MLLSKKALAILKRDGESGRLAKFANSPAGKQAMHDGELLANGIKPDK